MALLRSVQMLRYFRQFLWNLFYHSNPEQPVFISTRLLGEPLPAHLEKVRKAIQSLPQKSGAVVKPAKQV